jgi:localization factor PodJL
MSQYGSWSVKGIDDRARAAAKEKARLKGVTLGDYINDLLLQGHSEAGPRDIETAEDFSPIPSMPAPSSNGIETLARRLESIEARSTLAITGIDQSVLGLLARLENSENSTSAMAAEVDSMIDELRETHEALQAKVQNIEADDTAQQNLEAMKSLEQALGKLASHVYEESSLAQDEVSAVKGRVESGFAELSERVEGMEVKVETTLADAAKRVEKAVEQAELRAEGTSRHLSERFSAIESGVATKLSKVEEVDTRVSAIEGDVSGAITSMESTLVRIQERLNRAENTTDAALKALEHTFASLDERIETVAEHANPEKAEALRQHFEDRFEGLAADLRASVEQSRIQLANEIEQAAAGANPELMGRLEATVDTLKQRLVTGEERSSRALEAVSEQVNRLATGVNTRLIDIEDREDKLIEGVGEKIAGLASGFDERVAASERRSAAAIEQVGEQVATAIKRVQARQETVQKSVEDSVASANARQEARLSKALSSISDRLSDMQTQTVSAVSPVQKAIASLAARLEAVEDFSTPPNAPAPERALPTMAAMEPAPDIHIDEFETDLSVDPVEAQTPPEPRQQSDADFVAGLPNFDEVEEPEIDAEAFETIESWEITESDLVDEDYSTEPANTAPAKATFESEAEDEPELVHNYVADLPEEEDPLSALADWGDADEARDTDVFANDDSFAEDTMDQDTFGVPEVDFEAASARAASAPNLPQDDDATDYLARARRAAIAASSATSADKPNKKRGRRSAASASPKPAKVKTASGGKGSKLPVIAAAGVLAIATAGAGAYVALRGTQASPGGEPPEIITASSTGDASAASMLAGLDYDASAISADDRDLENTLFEPDTASDPTPATTATTQEAETATPAPQVPANLPVIPKPLTLERAAIEGNPVAQFQWGEARLAANDFASGADFVRRAAQQGLPAAQYRLSKLHEEGLGVPRDMIQARDWAEKAARGGNVKAMHDLAVFFADGEGGPQSYAGAVEWFRKAADFGLVDSQYNLAVLYENGLGISPSQVEALYWYEVAAANGDASAPDNVAALRSSLSLDQAQQAGRRAATWRSAQAVPASNGNFPAQSWQNGSREQVRAVQTVLNGLGYDAGVPDGVAGSGTRTAIRAFQADNGLATTGEVTSELVDALNAQAQS